MAGNKGRGRAAYTFNIEAVGFSRGEKLPDVVLKPPPLFPDTDYKPVPLKTGEGEDYVLALKQELRETMKRMPYFVETPEEKQDIERYSKRYMKVDKEEWIPDWRRLPRELMPRKKCKKAGPKSKKTKDPGKGTSLTNTADVLKKIEELEKRGDGEKSDEENEEKEGSKEKSKEGDDDDDDDAAEEEEYDEEEQEENPTKRKPQKNLEFAKSETIPGAESMAHGSYQARGQMGATSKPDLNHSCDLCPNSWQDQILNPLSEA